jgi:hypothetical protein
MPSQSFQNSQTLGQFFYPLYIIYLIYAKSVFSKQPNIGTVFLPTVLTNKLTVAWYYLQMT